MLPSSTRPPSRCVPGDDLQEYLAAIVKQSQICCHSIFASISYKTTFSDPLALLEAENRPDSQHCYFEKCTDEFSIACGDNLISKHFHGNTRFQEAKLWATEFLSSIAQAGDDPLAGTGPTLFLNASFEAEKSQKANSSLEIFLPKWQIVNQKGEHYAILNLEIKPTSKPEELQKKLDTRLGQMIGLKFGANAQVLNNKTVLESSQENYDYLAGVRKALEAIQGGRVSKIVLARQLTFDLNSSLSPFQIAHALRDRFPDCHTFSLSAPEHGTWVGASPETLARLRGNNLKTEALAGSAPRGPSAGKDALWGETLLAREKEVREHQLVIESIRRRLSSIGTTDIKQGSPRLLRLANLQHVKTPVEGVIPDDLHPFEVLEALHPTPAMGGSPRSLALSKLAEIEGAPRGWYSGVAGWMDSRGRSEFIVPIRCGRILPDSLTLYAGAGIVKGSVPELEKNETDWKLQAMLEVITGNPNLSF